MKSNYFPLVFRPNYHYFSSIMPKISAEFKLLICISLYERTPALIDKQFKSKGVSPSAYKMWHNLQSNPIALQTNKQNPKPIFVQRKPNVKNYSSTPPWHILAPTGIYFAGIPWLKTHSWFVEITSRLLKTATGENARIYSGKVNKKDQIKFSADNKFRRVRFPGLIRMKAIMFRLNLNLVRIKGSTWTIILFYSNC